jgi:hypothetical protein
MGHESPEPVIGQGLLVQRHADASYHGPKNLAARSRRIEDAAGRHGVDHARDPDDAELLVDLDLGEYRRMAEVRVFAANLRLGAGFFFDPPASDRKPFATALLALMR